ncbi:DUF4232 domain-containing protein [Streptomyces sp. NPDC005892]|uniref:DUF4232 domain-containing protein n=1 Tax=Streptomyces sp. NPDC005892 TaxID=3155593 RepID=UPI0033D2C62F
MRQLRTRRLTRSSVFGVAALIGALSLTACNDEDTAAIDKVVSSAEAAADDTASPAPIGTAAATDGEKSTQEKSSTSSGSKSSGSTSGTSGSGKSSTSGTSVSGTSGSGSSSTGSAGSAGSSDDSAGSDDDAPDSPVCDGSNTKVRASILSRPVNHVLLTVTNTGSTACDAFSYPGVGYAGAQSVMDYVRDSVPQAVVSLEPGQSAYASVRTASADGSGEGGVGVNAFTVDFQDASGSFENSTQVTVSLGKEVWVDSSAAVTYWLTDFEAATSY